MPFSFLISRWFGTSKSFLDERDLQTPGKSSRKTSFRAPVYRSIFICISAPGYRQSYKYQVLLNKGRFFKQQWEGHIKFSLEQRGGVLVICKFKQSPSLKSCDGILLWNRNWDLGRFRRVLQFRIHEFLVLFFNYSD